MKRVVTGEVVGVMSWHFFHFRAARVCKILNTQPGPRPVEYIPSKSVFRWHVVAYQAKMVP